MTPHARHLREMQETTRPEPPAAAIAAIPCRPLTGEELIAARAWEAEWRRDRELRAAYPDPTRRHLAEMRQSVDVAAAHMPIAAMLALPRTPTGDELVAAMSRIRKEQP